jgi:monoamine oxidase
MPDCDVVVVGAGLAGLTAARELSAAGRIHWAGAETATRWMGYMDGAISSGKRAAAEVMRAEGAALTTAPGARAAQAARVVSTGAGRGIRG